MTSQAFHRALSSLTPNCRWKLQISELERNLFVSPWFHRLVRLRAAQNTTIQIAFYPFCDPHPHWGRRAMTSSETQPRGQRLIDSHNLLHRNTSYGNFNTFCLPAWRHLTGLLMFATAEVAKKRRKKRKEEVRRRTGRVFFAKRCRAGDEWQQPTSENNTGGQLTENIIWYASRNNIIRKRWKVS